MPIEIESISSVSLVLQGEHRLYSLTMSSELLASTTFVIDREEDPIAGFQRVLDKKRATEIANYIDSGLGTIPSSIVLSAQPDANLVYDRKTKSIKFNRIPKAFLIIDGQHRVYGFRLAKSRLRVPVVIYDQLSKRDETRLFIDINSKQKGVPPELLLDIKKLAEYENNKEEQLREIYDTFMTEPSSALKTKMSPASKVKGKITRATFNSGLKNLLPIFSEKDVYEIFQILNNYIYAFEEIVLKSNNFEDFLVSSNGFKSIMGFFPIVVSKVKDRHGTIYSVEHFADILRPLGGKLRVGKIKDLSTSYKEIIQYFEGLIKSGLSV